MSTGSHTPRLPRALATAALRALGPICVAVIPVVTALIVWLGPDPSVPTGPSQLSASALQQSLHEPRDRVALVVWLLIVALITIAITSGVVRWLSSRRWIGDPRWVWATLPGMLLLGVGLLYPDDGFRVVPHIGPVEVVAGAVLAVAVVFIIAGRYCWRVPVAIVDEFEAAIERAAQLRRSALVLPPVIV